MGYECCIFVSSTTQLFTTTKFKAMTKPQIITALTTGPAIEEVDAAFQQADKKENFSYQFGKTSQYWSKSNWDKVAKAVKSLIGK